MGASTMTRQITLPVDQLCYLIVDAKERLKTVERFSVDRTLSADERKLEKSLAKRYRNLIQTLEKALRDH